MMKHIASMTSKALNIAVIFYPECQHILARVYHVSDLAPVSKENKCCMSQHTHITIVELKHGLHR